MKRNLILSIIVLIQSHLYAETRIEAESATSTHNVKIIKNGSKGKSIGHINKGSWAKLSLPAEIEGKRTVTVRISAKLDHSTSIEIRKGDENGQVLAEIPVKSTGNWNAYTDVSAKVDFPSGTDELTLFFKGKGGALCNVDYIAIE